MVLPAIQGRVPDLGTRGSQNFPVGQLSAGVEGYFNFVNMVPDYHDLVVSLIGNPGTANAVAMAGAREAAKWGKKYADEMADNPTGRMSSSVRARGRKTNPRIRVTNPQGETRWRNKFEGEPNRTEGARLTVNRKGDYSRKAGKRGGVRYGGIFHMPGKDRIWPGKPFLYLAVDSSESRAAATKAMERQWETKVLPRLVARAKVLQGEYGVRAEFELRRRMMRASQRLSAGRHIGKGRQRAAAERVVRAQVRNKSVIEHLANSVVNDLQDKALRDLELRSLASRTI